MTNRFIRILCQQYAQSAIKVGLEFEGKNLSQLFIIMQYAQPPHAR